MKGHRCERCDTKCLRAFFLTLGGKKTVVCEECWSANYPSSLGTRRHTSRRVGVDEPFERRGRGQRRVG